MPRPGPALVSVLCSGWLLSACHQASTPISLLQEGEVADLRITEPPWQPQELMTHRMQHLAAFLYNETGLKVRVCAGDHLFTQLFPGGTRRS